MSAKIHEFNPLIIILRNENEKSELFSSIAFKPYAENSKCLSSANDIKENMHIFKNTYSDKPIFLSTLNKNLLTSVAGYFFQEVNLLITYPMQGRWTVDRCLKYFEQRTDLVNLILMTPKQNRNNFSLESTNTKTSYYKRFEGILRAEHERTVSNIKSLISKDYKVFLENLPTMDDKIEFKNIKPITIYISNDKNRNMILNQLKWAFLKYQQNLNKLSKNVFFRFVLLNKTAKTDVLKTLGEYNPFLVYSSISSMINDIDEVRPSELLPHEDMIKLIFASPSTNAIIYAGGESQLNIEDVKSSMSKHNKGNFQSRIMLFYSEENNKEAFQEIILRGTLGESRPIKSDSFIEDFISAVDTLG